MKNRIDRLGSGISARDKQKMEQATNELFDSLDGNASCVICYEPAEGAVNIAVSPAECVRDQFQRLLASARAATGTPDGNDGAYPIVGGFLCQVHLDLFEKDRTEFLKILAPLLIRWVLGEKEEDDADPQQN